MGVQFILGRAGAGKTRWCIDSIVSALSQETGGPLIFLVPEQATYQVERSILSAGVAGYSRLNVLSFNRLGFLLCGRGGDLFQPGSIGRRMILRRILDNSVGRFSAFGGADGPGLAGELAELCSRLYRQETQPCDLFDAAKAILGKNPDSLTGRKLSDIAVIFDAYISFLDDPANMLVNPDAALRLARRQVRQSPVCRDAIVWVDGFSGFTVQQRALLTELLSVSRQGYIALCLDPNESQAGDPADTFSVFAPVQRTYAELLGALDAAGVSVGRPILCRQARRFELSPALGRIESDMFTYGRTDPIAAAGQVCLAVAADIRTECQWVAGQICRLVANAGYRYRDIAVIAPRMELYGPYLDSALAGCDIPRFIDQPRCMRDHPLVELLTNALGVVAGDFNKLQMSAYLKTGLSGISSQQADMLDNFCRACGISGRDWLSADSWTTGKQAGCGADELNGLRQKVIGPLQRLGKAMFSQELLTAADFTRAVWGFLAELNVASQMADWSPQDGEHHQLWRRLTGVFDELCLVFGRDAMSPRRLVSIFADALNTLTLKLIPPGLDQVLIGSVERSRHPDLSAVFIVGMTWKDFPVPLSQDVLLGQSDVAAAGSLFAGQALENRLAERRYLSYIALSRAGSRLFLSYPLVDQSLSAQEPWPGLERLKSLVDEIEIVYPSSAPRDIGDVATLAEFSDWLCRTLGPDSPADAEQKRLASELLSLLRKDSDEKFTAAGRLAGGALDYRNIAVLEPAGIALPHGFSVSRLESFAACPYRYFARYTLGLRRRELLGLEPVDTGQFYHAVLDRLFAVLSERRLRWRDADGQQLADLCRQQAGLLLENDRRLSAFARQGAHHRYLLNEAVETLVRFTATLTQLDAAGDFEQVCSEYRFGGDVPGLEIACGGGRVIRLGGCIDRVDCAEVNGKCVAVVYDYKRSGRAVSWSRMLHGLDMQLAVYLLTLAGRDIGGRHIDCPAGAFFLPVEPKPEAADPGDTDERQSGNRAAGVFDGRFAGDLDRDAKQSGWSRYYPFANSKADGQYGWYGTSGALKPEDFGLLLRFCRHKIVSLSEAITSGCIDIRPYRLGGQSPCSQCDYRPVCKFDWLINDYRLLETVRKPAALERMSKEAGV